MKKCALLLLVFLLLSMTACHGKSDMSAYELFSALTEKIVLPPCQVASFRADDTNSPLLLRMFFQGSDRLHPALSLCDDYLICTGSGSELFEICLFRTASLYDTPQVEEMLAARAALLESGAMGDALTDTTQVTVLTAQNFVILLATDNNDRFVQTIRSLLSTAT